MISEINSRNIKTITKEYVFGFTIIKKIEIDTKRSAGILVNKIAVLLHRRFHISNITEKQSDNIENTLTGGIQRIPMPHKCGKSEIKE